MASATWLAGMFPVSPLSLSSGRLVQDVQLYYRILHAVHTGKAPVKKTQIFLPDLVNRHSLAHSDFAAKYISLTLNGP